MSGYEALRSLGVTFRPISQLADRRDGETYSPFRTASFSQTVDLLGRELRAINARNVIVEVDLREQDFRLDGLPRANARASSDAVVLQVGDSIGGPFRLPANRFYGWQENVRALALALEALRKVDRYGVTKRGEQYRGFRALPSGSGPDPARGRTLITKHGGVRQALRATHPDHGGDAADFADVQAARDQGQNQ